MFALLIALLPLALATWVAAICMATKFQNRTVLRNTQGHKGTPRPGRLPALENEPLKPTIPLAWEAEWKFVTGTDFIPDEG